MARQLMIFEWRLNVKPIDRLLQYIKSAHPDATVTLTSPLHKEGVWSIDVTCGDKQLIVEWSLATGFGVSNLSNESYGERPDETFKSIKEVERRITELLSTNERTSPPLGVLLSRLRELRGFTQEELASKLSVRQATVSGMERRDDIQFSTLRRVINALTGSIEIFAVFSDARYRLGPRSISFAVDDPSPFVECKPESSGLPGTPSKSAFDPHYKTKFEALQEAGELSRALKVAEDISSRGMVLEMAD
jgi:transcriptional regulator with XRE-family HTH domain